MKVAKRVATGYAAFMLMTLGLVSYQAYAFRNLQTVNRENAGDNLNAVLTAIQLIRDIDALEGCETRYFSNRDPDHLNQLESARGTFESELNQVRGFAGNERKNAETQRLTRFWTDYLAVAKTAQQAPQSAVPGALPQEVADQVERLRAQAFTVYEVSKAVVTVGAETARKTGERIQYMVWLIAGATLAVGAFMSIVIVRSISIPLRALAQGTRAISEGKNFYRLDTSRSDEFSQIAKDFNDLTKHIPGTRQPE